MGGSCILNAPCENFSFLWDLSFGGYLGNNTNYFISPLGAFANNTASGECELLINYLDTPNVIILGTTWLQQWEIYGTGTELQIQTSYWFDMGMSFIGNV